MRDNVPCEFPAGYDGTAILDGLAQVLDPELDESILDVGFVRSLQLRSGHASVALRLPTSWCAVNFAYLMAEDIRRALLMVEGGRREPGCAPPHLPAQGVSRPPTAPVARAARSRLLAGGHLRAAPRRSVGAGGHDCDPTARLCAGQGWSGGDPAAVFGAPSRARPRLQPRRSADCRP